MNLPNDTMCILPWISIETSPIGTLRPCCMADTELRDENGNTFLAGIDSLESVRAGEDMHKLRHKMLNDIKPEICRRCWAEEDAGRTSKRQNTIKRLDKIIGDDSAWGVEPKDLLFLDLKLGNICNLKCRICGSWSSSSIAAEDFKGEGKEGFAYTMLKAGAWPRNEPEFWNELYDTAPSIRYLEFTGGEPFLIKEHFEYLQYLVDAKFANNIEIHYNTNGTQYPDKYIWLWEHFKHVEIAFSIDNIGDRFEYERSNAKWDAVNNNISRFVQLRNEYSNISLQLCTTINIFNVLYLKDIVAWNMYNKFDFVFWNMLHDAPEWCITSLPYNVKQAVAKKLKHSLLLDQDIQDEFSNIVDFMRQKSKVTVHGLMTKIKDLDLRRDEHLKNTHPELWKLLQEATFEKTG